MPCLTLGSDGGFVVFDSAAASIVPNDGNRDNDVFGYDLNSNVMELVSMAQPKSGARVPNGQYVLTELGEHQSRITLRSLATRTI